LRYSKESSSPENLRILDVFFGVDRFKDIFPVLKFWRPRNLRIQRVYLSLTQLKDNESIFEIRSIFIDS